MIKRLFTRFCRIYENLQLIDDALLPDDLFEELRAQAFIFVVTTTFPPDQAVVLGVLIRHSKTPGAQVC